MTQGAIGVLLDKLLERGWKVFAADLKGKPLDGDGDGSGSGYGSG